MIDTRLTPLPLVVPSSLRTPRGTNEGLLTLSISPLPLAPCIGLKVGEPFRDDYSHYDEDDSLAWSEELALVGNI